MMSMLRYDQLYVVILLCFTNNVHTLLIFFLMYHKPTRKAIDLYGRYFPFFRFLASVFTKDRAYGNARDHIRDDAAQYEYDVEIKLEEDA